MTEKVEQFLITITVIEGRHFIWPNADTAVHVMVDDKKKCTNISNNTDSPFFNEYFTFEFLTNLENLLDTKITLTVLQPKKLLKPLQILGTITLDTATVWNQPNHQFFNKWATIEAPISEVTRIPRGYLKLSIIVFKKGESPQIPDVDIESTDEIESNLLLPECSVSERQRAAYVFKIYKGENLSKAKYLDMMNLQSLETDPPSSYVEVSFAGLKAKTSTVKNNTNPVWNQSLILTDLFPPLYQRIKIRLYFVETFQTVYAEHYINLRTVSNDGERGFLPTFGPAFVYFYSQGSTNEGYVGKILIAFNTQLHSDVKFQKCAIVEPMSGILETNLWKYEPILLFGTIFNVNLINKTFSDKPVCFEINFGNTENIFKKYNINSDDLTNRTISETPITKNKLYWSIDFKKNKPCIYIHSLWPNFSRRVYNSNIISKIALELRIRLNTIESQFEKNELKYIENKITKSITETLDFVLTACRKYLDITKSLPKDYENDLDKHWKQLGSREIENIENVCINMSSLQPKTKCVSKLQTLLNKLELLAEDAQTCFPRIYVSMSCGNRREAFSKCFSHDILYSVVNEERGNNCGVIQNLFLQPIKKSNSLNLNSTIACKMDISLWLGFDRHKNALLKSIPDGFSLPSNLSSESLPKTLIALQQHFFQCRVHIYQAKLSPGFDTSGLCDSFVRIIIEDKCNDTLVKQNTLNPVWDQMFSFTNLVLYGTKSHITANLPLIVIEVYDYDKYAKSEFIGRSILNPVIKFIKEPYRAPNFPPKLSWYPINNDDNIFGHVLVATEYLEISKLEETDDATPAIVEIPDDIKPKLATYRLEIIFWGVRNLQKVDLFAISKPKVVLECGQKSLHSDTILNIQNNLNFIQMNKFMDISLPEEEDYAPQICIKIFDSRSFGRNVLIGTHLISINNISYRALTVDQREKTILESNELDLIKMKTKQLKSITHMKKNNKVKLHPKRNAADEGVQTEKTRKTSSCGWVTKCYNCCFNVKSDNIEKINENVTAKVSQKKVSKKSSKRDNEIVPEESPKIAHHSCIWTCLFGTLIQKKNEKNYKKNKMKMENKKKVIETVEDAEDYDWWTKYYCSMQKFDKNNENNLNVSSKKFTLKIYSQELELEKDFNAFSDLLKTFEVYKGKRTGDDIIDDANITGIFKGALRIYKWPVANIENLVIENGLPFSNGAFQSFPSNSPIKFLARVYCVCGINLRPKDINGKSDPYLVITMNDKVINDRKTYISKQVNPIFGRCYEFNGTFSQNHSITVSVWDWDLTSSDDLIGETKIDIENRFYSRHRANCGLASEYNEMGYCAWRDNEKPTKILENVCRQNNVGTPYYNQRSIKIATKEFVWPVEENINEITDHKLTNPSKQELALFVLQNWQQMPLVGYHLVPEHVETRSLYHPAKLGIEQGKIQLWVDIFACTDFPPPPRVDITPRKPVDYELRIIIWNTDEIILEEDDFFVGEKMSDIYVSGWMINSDESQCTDIHYRSMTGEGNFNWRFIFRFKYLSTENKIVVSKKESLFSVDETEYKYPCRLTLKVWDNDMLSADDFLGSLILDLSRLPRGSRTVEKCSLNNMSNKAPTMNLFKTKRTRGWWPFHGVDPITNTTILAGKVEVEFELLTVEEAEKRPAGLQRSEPQPLPLPNRPDTSFSWFKNPLKALKFLICKHYRCKIIKCILFTLMVLFLLAAVYSVPGNSVKKLLHILNAYVMPNLIYFLQMVRSWRIDTEDAVENKAPSTPVINVLPSVEDPEKKSVLENVSSQPTSSALAPVTSRFDWFSSILSKISVRRGTLKSAPGDSKELQNMLPSSIVIGSKSKQQKPDHEVCLMTESPFRILRAAESGNIETFQRLYFTDPARLVIQDARGRTASHQAAFKNRTNILQFINAHGGDLNIQDSAGNTPLHVAVESESLDAVDYLLEIGVDSSILNEKKQAPVHLVTELNKANVLQVMVNKHKSRIDIQQGGEHGRTALHIAAIYDHEECARILITQFGASPRQPCNNGYYPIHEAAKNASSKTLEVFLQWGESQGCSRDEMISFYDAEGNVPLHSAVHGGDLKAVELCIKSGAKISTQQHDLSTPVHLACAQGATEIVKIMFKMQPEEKAQCLLSCDIQKMTPLHCAAMFNHPEIVECLISEGADINQVDKEKRSPLLLAASRAGWKTVHTLIRLGADINIKDINRRNVLHLVVMNGGRLEKFASEVCKAQTQTNLLQLLNEKDDTGCSPLHYASREGHIRSLENLIRLGAVINLKNNNNESPLHFAARYGRYNTVRQLLDSEKGTFIINESDGEGMTPLHIASQQGHTRVVQLLLNRGALLHRDHNGRNPLHLAAMNGYTQTIELLLCVHSHLLDQLDKDGNTALHLATMENKPTSIVLLLSMKCKLLYNKIDMSAVDYAIHYKYPEAALAMVTHEERADEIMLLKSDKHPCVALALIASMPRVFEAVQDKCITKANCKKDSKSFYVKYSFNYLQCSQFYANMDGKTGEALSISKPIPLPALNAMVSHGRVELLAHPLSQKYLQMKWNSYGKYFHIANLLFYSIFLSFVTLFSAKLMNYETSTNNHNGSLSNNISSIEKDHMHKLNQEHLNDLQEKIYKVNMCPFMHISAMGIVVYIGLNSVREIIQIYQQKFLYFMDPINLVSWLLYISASIMVSPVFGGSITEMQFSFASLTVFLSWLNLLLLLQRFDQVGIYVVMFLEILQTLIKVLMVFSILIIAFGLAFYILLSRGEHLSFRSIPISLMRTFSMMLGEIDFLGTYVEPFYLKTDEAQCHAKKTTLPFPIPSFFILGIFMVLMPILLMNLLIGLAVGDIESVRRNAQLKRLAMQVVLHTELETKLPKILLEKIDKNELIEYPNDTKCKLGFFDSIIRRWFGNPFSDDGSREKKNFTNTSRRHGAGLDMMIENNEDFLASELDKTKRKLREISTSLDSQQQLLRLIVQKMEIKTEADDVDEGVSANDLRPLSAAANKWTSPRIRKKLLSTMNFSKPS